MILTEPADVYRERIEERHRQADALVHAPTQYEDAWDEPNLVYLRGYAGRALPFMEVVNVLGKSSPPQSKREREQAKLQVSKRLAALIHTGQVARRRRCMRAAASSDSR